MTSRSNIVENFIAVDAAYFTGLEHMRTLDPLQVRANDVLRTFQTRESTPEAVEVSASLSQRVVGIMDDPTTSELEILATKRDFDKVLGHFVATKAPLPEDVEAALGKILETQSNPRADFYNYTLGNNAELAGTYTGDEREVNLIELFGTSIMSAHFSLHTILRARQALRTGDSADAAQALKQTLEHVTDMHEPMIATYRDVGPAFVAQDVTRFLGPVKSNDVRYEGPNPSHSGFVALDRFAYGSFEPLFDQQPFLRGQFAYRMSDMPAHLVNLMEEANTSHDDESIVDLTEGHSAYHKELASEIANRIRKFKVVHKSYADKGLESKGGKITTEEPDVLSESIKFARRKES